MSAGLPLLLLVFALPLVWMAFVHNRLVGLRTGVRNAFAGLDGPLKRRHDLVPELVDLARSRLAHDRGTLDAVVAARQSAASARASAAARWSDRHALDRLDAAEITLSTAVARLIDTLDAHADGAADAPLARLIDALVAAEDRIDLARRGYNDAVGDYNAGTGRFPDALVAATFSFRAARPLGVSRAVGERLALADAAR
jgi:LemA protein